MSRIYNGPVPCVGCNEPKPRYGKNELCHDCVELIELGKGVKRHHTTGFSLLTFAPYNIQSVTKYESDKKELTTGGFPYLSDSKLNQDEIPGSSKSVVRTLENLMKTLDEGKKPKIDFRFGMNEARWNDGVYIKTETANKYFYFIKAFSEYANRIEKEAFEKGCDLLGGLNSGEMTLKQFEQRIKK